MAGNIAAGMVAAQPAYTQKQVAFESVRLALEIYKEVVKAKQESEMDPT